jgi:PTH1 family peptidyl-tRNA hydrolase
MKFIVGLGNPGKEYAKTRHNVGFMVADALVQHPQPEGTASFRSVPKLHLELAKFSSDILIAKPQTYMNDSGRAVRALLDFYKVPASEWSDSLYVIHDDLDIQLGECKMQLGKGPKVHNGLLSIYSALGTQNFWHVRVGVDNRQGQRFQAGREYVLEGFTKEESQQLDQVIQEVSQRLLP